jgi:hypothetical protein
MSNKTAPLSSLVLHSGSTVSPIANDAATLNRLARYPMRALTATAMFATAMQLEAPHANSARTIGRSAYRAVIE